MAGDFEQCVAALRGIIRDARHAHSQHISKPEVYIGVTRSLAWRWHGCRGYNRMQPHETHYDRLHAITIDYAPYILNLERGVIDWAWDNEATFGARVGNRVPGGGGTAQSGIICLHVTVQHAWY